MIQQINYTLNLYFGNTFMISFFMKPKGVIVQLGGQTALKLAEKLERYDINIMELLQSLMLLRIEEDFLNFRK